MFIAKVTSLMNTEILGSENNVGQWKMPIEKKAGSNERVIGKVNFENYRGRIIMNKIDKLVDVCIVEEDQRRKWMYAVTLYNNSMQILRKKLITPMKRKRHFSSR